MQIEYSSNRRTTKRRKGDSRSITKHRSRQFKLRTSSSQRKRSGINWGSIIAFLVRIAKAAAEGLLGSGKGRVRPLPEPEYAI